MSFSIISSPPSILGTGVAFPVRLDSTGSRMATVSEEDLVESDIFALLSTRKGERPFRIKNGVLYGVNLDQALFAPVEVAIDIISYETKQALQIWEPRIVYFDTVVTSTRYGSSIVLQAKTTFRYRATNREDNLVVPYKMGG